MKSSNSGTDGAHAKTLRRTDIVGTEEVVNRCTRRMDVTNLKNEANTPSECIRARTALVWSGGGTSGSLARSPRRTASDRSHRAITPCMAAVSSRDTMLLPPPTPLLLPTSLTKLLMPTLEMMLPDRVEVPAPTAAAAADCLEETSVEVSDRGSKGM